MEILQNISLSDKNTFRIGGKARYYLEPKSQDEILSGLQYAHENDLPVFILGKGSNVLISDDGWPGLVVNLSSRFGQVCWVGEKLVADGGVLLNTVVNMAIDAGYAGMEELAGIPGTVGGAVIMNAGAFNSCIADTLHEVQYLDCKKSKIFSANLDDLKMGYRTSSLHGTESIVLRAEFLFSRKSTAEQLRALRQDILSRRKSKQPLEYPNCGSVFKRPVGNFAGTLIEQCGLKGLMAGGAEVSTKHANFIVNKGEAKASDVRHLIVSVQRAVYERFGILLEPEVIFIGKFDEPLFKP